MNKLDKVCRLIEDCDYISVLTGAGMSVESGVAPFRGEDGLWEEFDPEKYAHIRSYERDPERSWKLFRLQIKESFDSEPHKGYRALVDLEDHGLRSVITQNIDGLHQRAGSEHVIELHGTLSRLICEDCQIEYRTEEFMDDILREKIPVCECGNILRPDVVLFGDQLDPADIESAITMVQESDLVLVVGTSSIVQPAASLPAIAKNSGASLVEINLEETPITDNISDLYIRGKAGAILKCIIDEL